MVLTFLLEFIFQFLNLKSGFPNLYLIIYSGSVETGSKIMTAGAQGKDYTDRTYFGNIKVKKYMLDGVKRFKA